MGKDFLADGELLGKLLITRQTLATVAAAIREARVQVLGENDFEVVLAAFALVDRIVDGHVKATGEKYFQGQGLRGKGNAELWE